MNRQRVRIVSDGSPNAVQVTDAITGALIPHVRSVTWTATVNGLPTAMIETLLAEVDVTCDAEIGDPAALIKIYGELLTPEQFERVVDFIRTVASEGR